MRARDYSTFVNEELVQELQRLLREGAFPEMELEDAMAFLLSDGIVPRTGLPVSSLLALDDWATKQRSRLSRGE